MSDQIQYVFPGNVSPEQALRQVGDAVDELNRQSLRIHKESGQRASETLSLHRWREEGEVPTVIDVTVDRSIPMVFVSVLSKNREHASDLAARLNASLRLPSADSLIEAAQQDPNDAAALLRAATAAGDDVDPRLQSLVETGMRGADRDQRAAAIKAAALLTWPVFAQALRAAMGRESDPELKRFLVIALKKCGS